MAIYQNLIWVISIVNADSKSWFLRGFMDVGPLLYVYTIEKNICRYYKALSWHFTTAYWLCNFLLQLMPYSCSPLAPALLLPLLLLLTLVYSCSDSPLLLLLPYSSPVPRLLPSPAHTPVLLLPTSVLRPSSWTASFDHFFGTATAAFYQSYQWHLYWWVWLMSNVQIPMGYVRISGQKYVLVMTRSD